MSIILGCKMLFKSSESLVQTSYTYFSIQAFNSIINSSLLSYSGRFPTCIENLEISIRFFKIFYRIFLSPNFNKNKFNINITIKAKSIFATIKEVSSL